MDNNNYQFDERNKRNINNFNEGVADNSIHNPAMNYQFNGLSRRDIPGYQLSLACQSGTDINHTIGNVTAIVLQFIIDQFPRNTFATALPSTQVAHRQLRHTPKQIRQQPYPICIVNPRISLSGIDNRLAAGSFGTTLWNTTSNRFQNRSEMEKLFFDKQKGIEWRGKLNRIVINFDFVLSFQSRGEQLRWASYLINKIPTDGFFDIDTALEMALPDGFLEETSKYAKVPIKGPNGDISKFVDYLNMHAVFPVSYRFSSGRHTDAFYMYYGTALLCSISDLNYQTVNKKNNVESDCPIVFTLRCEFNTIGMFDLSVPNPGMIRHVAPLPNSVSIPIFSDCFNERDFPLLYGWQIHSKPICKMDWGETEIYIGGSFGNALNEMIDYHLEHHLNPELFINVNLRENHDLINDGYYVDWKRRVLIFTTINYANTYRLIITINQLYINDMLKAMYGKE